MKAKQTRPRPWDVDAAAEERWRIAQETAARLIAARTLSGTKKAAPKAAGAKADDKSGTGETKKKKTAEPDYPAAPTVSKLRTLRAALRAASRAPLRVRGKG